jgi:hypothetical protein
MNSKDEGPRRQSRRGREAAGKRRQWVADEVLAVMAQLHADPPLPMGVLRVACPRLRRLLGRFVRCRSFEGRFRAFGEFFATLDEREQGYFRSMHHCSLPMTAREACQVANFMTLRLQGRRVSVGRGGLIQEESGDDRGPALRALFGAPGENGRAH